MKRPAAQSGKANVGSSSVKRSSVTKVRSKVSTKVSAKPAARQPEVLDLGRDLVHATLVRRPSARNRSPWVADVKLDSGRIALAHVPALDMGGLCVEGSKLLLKPAVDGKGRLVGAKAVGSYGTPKCEFILQLVRISEPENSSTGGCWCAAHPGLGEKLAAALLEKNLVSELQNSESIRREVANIAGCDMRADFVVQHGRGKRTVVEVKTVLNTDYNPSTAPARKECVYLGPSTPYRRAGIFPWGRVAQTGPDGEQVVSARAIKHVDELASIAKGDRTCDGERLSALLLFVVVRDDVASLRVNQESCASFARHAKAAQAAGVRIVAHRIRWGDGKDLGKAFWAGPLPVEVPQILSKRPAASTDAAPKRVRTKQ
eukprot:TRINITY_DN15472_c0_g1_i1.p1 TRINITY_DN15472_c0_g1~~TRINITY_DN15472_c0_g1_i1.p1  ORF type:complete len:373 (+),score=54.53 TRINITY_DN15472_c0_g1_i1:52-1170(+)